MDDQLVKALIEEGRALRDEINQVREEFGEVKMINHELLKLLKGNGHKGFLSRLEILESKTLMRNPVTYIAVVSLCIALVKLIMG